MFSRELRRLLEEVADICDGGQYLDMKGGADSRYDGKSYGEGLLIAYQNFLATEEGSKWYGDAVEENHRAVYGDVDCPGDTGMTEHWPASFDTMIDELVGVLERRGRLLSRDEIHRLAVDETGSFLLAYGEYHKWKESTDANQRLRDQNPGSS